MTASIVLLMGVSGSGKTTVGMLLAQRLQWPFADADGFHSAANIAKMAAGVPLTDADRAPWLQTIRTWIDQHVTGQESAVVTCSALKRSYRDVLRRPEVLMVYLQGSRQQIEQRLKNRKGHFFKPDLLDSQLQALQEPAADEGALTVSIDGTPEEIVEAIVRGAGL